MQFELTPETRLASGALQRARAVRSAHPTVRLTPSQILVLALWFGLLSGLGEIVIALVRIERGRAVHQFPELLWMAPLADVFLFTILGLVLALMVSVWARPGSLRLVTFAYLFVAFLGLLLNLEWLETYVALLLAAGISFQLSYLVATRPWLLRWALAWTTGWARPVKALRRLALGRSSIPASDVPLVDRRQVVVASGASIAGLVTGLYGYPYLRERRAQAALPPAPVGRPNVLFIMLDTVRAQSLSLLGYGRPTTPNLERLARAGVLFQNAIASAPWTLPSHAGMFTGLPLHITRVNDLRPYGGSQPTLAEWLSAQGYQTAGFVSNFYWLGQAFGLQRDFVHHEAYQVTPTQILVASALGRGLYHDKQLRASLVPVLGKGRKRSSKINQSFLDWAKARDHHRPFFAFLNYLDTHDPYDPPKGLVGRFGFPPPHNPRVDLNKVYEAEELEALRAAYEECILGLDRDVGQLLEQLRYQGDLENTLVIITSDHGEQLGEHDGLMQHCTSLYLPLIHVPLVIFCPGRVPSGAVVPQPVSLLDLPSTLCDLIGLGRQHPFPGQSLAPLWEGGAAARQRRDIPVRSEAEPIPTKLPARYPVSRGPMKSLMWREYHYIRNGDGKEELYDRVADPWEKHNLAESGTASQEMDYFRSSLAT
jgi:arylsulfatase A-like enzyme